MTLQLEGEATINICVMTNVMKEWIESHFFFLIISPTMDAKWNN